METMATDGEPDESHEVSNEVEGLSVNDKLCEVCSRKSISSKATVLCKPCDQVLCDQCSGIHSNDTTKTHHLVKVTNMFTAKGGFDMEGFDICGQHMKEYEFYCEDHKLLCCSRCIIGHRVCEKFHEIDFLCGQENTELRELKYAMEKTNTETCSFIQDLKISELDFNKTVDDLANGIDAMRDRVLALFANVKSRLLQEAEGIRNEKVERLKQLRGVLSNFNKDISKMMPIYSGVLDKGTPQQSFILARTFEKTLNDAELYLEEVRRTPLTMIIHLNHSCELTNLVNDGDRIMNITLDQSTVQFRPLTMELIKSTDLPENGDDQCEPFLTGLDFIPDGRLIAVDNWNMKCFIMNDQLQRLGKPYKFKSNPRDVACLSENEIAVTVADKSIVLLSVSPKNVLKLTKTINTLTEINSVYCITATSLVVSTIQNPRLAKIVTVDGLISEFENVVFPKKTYKLSESYCAYVTSKNKLILVDRIAHTVYLYDTENGTSRAVTNEHLQEPFGACVGPDDTVLVCSAVSKCIVHMTSEGDIIGTYPVDIKCPDTLCVSKNGTRLAVTNRCKGTKKLNMYELSPASVIL